MADEVYSFEIAAEVAKARKAIEQFSAETQKRLDGINFKTTISAISDGFNLISAAAKPAIDAIKNLASEALDEAIKAEKEQVALANALRITGDYSEEAARQFESFASAIQRTTVFSGGQVAAAAALAKQYRLTNAETKQAVTVATDLAARLGIDLDQATQKIAQSYNGFVDKSLAKVVPGLKNLTKEALASGAALDLIRAQVNGSAAALANTFGGALAQTRNSFNDILQTLGDLIVKNPAVIAGIKEIGKAFNQFNDGLKANGDTLRDLVTDGFLFLVRSVPLVIQAIRAIDSGFATLKATTKDIIILVTKLPTALLQAATGSLDALDDLKQALASVDDAAKFAERAKLYDPLIKGAEDLAKRIEKAAKNAKTLNKEISAGKSSSGAAARLAEIFPQEELDRQLQQIKDAQQKIRDIVKTSIEGSTKEPLQGFITFAITGQSELTKVKNEIDSTIAAIKNSKDIPAALKAQAIGFAEEAKKGLERQFNLASTIGIIGSITKGAEGAKKLVTSALGAAANALVPGIGGAVEEIAGVLAEGPDKVREMVRQFVAALPQLIKNIAQAGPVLVEELIKSIPSLIQGLVNELPSFIQGFVAQVPQIAGAFIALAPKIAIAFASSLVSNIPNIVESFAKEFLKIPERFVKALIDSIPGAGGILGGGGGGGGILGGIGSVFSSIGDFFGFAEGGTVARNPAFSGDRGLARIGPNETVVDSELTDWLRKLKNGGSGLSGSQPDIVINVGLQQFARLVFDARTAGYRV